MNEINLSIFKDALEQIYPERYDIVDDDYIIIHFPEVEINNKYNESVKIHDLFTIFKFNNYLNYDYIELHGWMMTPTSKQYNRDYAHSHLPPSTTGYAELKHNLLNYECNFCLGNGTLNKLISSWQRDFTNVNIFECVLYELGNFVGWESIDGGPYSKLKDITNNSNNIDYQRYYDNCNFDYIISKLYEFNESVPIGIINNSKISSTIDLNYTDSKFESKLITIIENTIKEVYLSDDSININVNALDKNRYIPFRGQNIKLKIFEESIISELKVEDIKNDVIKYILAQIKYKFENLIIDYKYYEYINDKE